MKKKLVVLLMASSMALAACGSKDTAATTAAVETTVAESTEAEATEAESTEAESTEAETTEAESTEAGEVNVGDVMGFELEEKDGKYFMNYPAAMFEGLPEDVVKEAVSADSEGIVTINDDGSVVVELTKDEFDALNVTLGQ